MKNPYRILRWLRFSIVCINKIWLSIVALWAAIPLSFGVSYVVFGSTEGWWLVFACMTSQYMMLAMLSDNDSGHLYIPMPVSDLVGFEKQWLKTELTNLLLSFITPLWCMWIFGEWLFNKMKQKHRGAHFTALVS